MIPMCITMKYVGITEFEVDNNKFEAYITAYGGTDHT